MEEREYEEIQKDLLQKSNLEYLRRSAHLKIGTLKPPQKDKDEHRKAMTKILLWSTLGRGGYRSYYGRMARAIAENVKEEVKGPPKEHIQTAANHLIKAVTRFQFAIRSIDPKEWEQRGFEPEEVREVHHYVNEMLAIINMRAFLAKESANRSKPG